MERQKFSRATLTPQCVPWPYLTSDYVRIFSFFSLMLCLNLSVIKLVGGFHCSPQKAGVDTGICSSRAGASAESTRLVS